MHTKNERKEIIFKLFNDYDKDNSGYLDKEESQNVFISCLKKMGILNELNNKKIIKNFDKFYYLININNNGKVEFKQFFKIMDYLFSDCNCNLNKDCSNCN